VTSFTSLAAEMAAMQQEYALFKTYTEVRGHNCSKNARC
jgi:hypothetical protein